MIVPLGCVWPAQVAITRCQYWDEPSRGISGILSCNTHPLLVTPGTPTPLVYPPLLWYTHPWYTHPGLGIPSPRRDQEPGIPTPYGQADRHQWKHYLSTTLLVGSKHDPYEFVCFDAYNKQTVRYSTIYHLCNNNVSVPSDDHKYSDNLRQFFTTLTSQPCVQ